MKILTQKIKAHSAIPAKEGVDFVDGVDGVDGVDDVDRGRRGQRQSPPRHSREEPAPGLNRGGNPANNVRVPRSICAGFRLSPE